MLQFIKSFVRAMLLGGSGALSLWSQEPASRAVAHAAHELARGTVLTSADIEPPATPGAPTASVKMDMGFTQNSDSRTNGEASRQHLFRSAHSARVIAVSPSGMLQVRGKKLVNIDKNQQDVTVTGWIRPQDVHIGTNTVESTRLADAEVVYGQKGDLGKPRSGILSRVLGALWP